MDRNTVKNIEEEIKNSGWRLEIEKSQKAKIRKADQIFYLTDFNKHYNTKKNELYKAEIDKYIEPVIYAKCKKQAEELENLEKVFKKHGVDINTQLEEFVEEYIVGKPYITNYCLANSRKNGDRYSYDEIYEIETIGCNDGHHMLIATTMFDEYKIDPPVIKEDVRSIRLNEFISIETLPKNIYDRQKTDRLDENSLFINSHPDIIYEIQSQSYIASLYNVEKSLEQIHQQIEIEH